MHWRSRKEAPPFRTGDIIQHVNIERYLRNEESPQKPILLISTMKNTDFHSFVEMAQQIVPYSVIQPFDATDPGWTSRAANRVFDNIEGEIHVGVVVSGHSEDERLDHF